MMVSPRSKRQAEAIYACEWLNQELPARTRIAGWHSGIMQYYTPNLTVINIDGLANNDILSVLRGEKTMNQYWDEMEVEYVLGRPESAMAAGEEEWDGKRLEYAGPEGRGRKLLQKIVTVESP